MLGAAAVAFHGGRLYEVAAGHMTVSPKLSWVAPGRKLRTVTDVGEFNNDHPPPPQNGDAVPGGNPYDLVSLGKKLYISDGNYNRVLEADPLTGGLRILATFYPGPVTVGMAAAPDQKELYVAQYGNAPYLPGSGYITAVTPEGKVRKAVTGLTTPIDMAFGEGRDAVRPPVRREVRLEAPPLRRQHRVAAPDRQGRDEARAPHEADVPDRVDDRPGRRDLHLRLRQRVQLRRGRHPPRCPRRLGRRRAGRAAAEGARHLRHPEVERDPRPGRERRGRGEGRHRRAEGGAQVGLLAQGDPREGRPEGRLHEHRADLAHRDLEDGRVRHRPDQAQPVRDRRPEQARVVRAHLHAPPVDEGDDSRQRQVGRRIAGRGDPGRQRGSRPRSTPSWSCSSSAGSSPASSPSPGSPAAGTAEA